MSRSESNLPGGMDANSDDLSSARQRMVERQLTGRGIRDARVLDAMRRVPREAFVDEKLEAFAYADGPLPIGDGQTISQPYIVARMIEAAKLRPSDRVLEVGTGSGYAAAVLSRIAAKVYTIERHAALADSARQRFARLGYENIEVRIGDGTLGWAEESPFQAILVAAAAPTAPRALKQQLSICGRLVVPLGGFRDSQTLRRITRTGDADFEEDELEAVIFVPLVGAHGWTEDGDHGSEAVGN